MACWPRALVPCARRYMTRFLPTSLRKPSVLGTDTNPHVCACVCVFGKGPGGGGGGGGGGWGGGVGGGGGGGGGGGLHRPGRPFHQGWVGGIGPLFRFELLIGRRTSALRRSVTYLKLGPVRVLVGYV